MSSTAVRDTSLCAPTATLEHCITVCSLMNRAVFVRVLYARRRDASGAIEVSDDSVSLCAVNVRGEDYHKL